MLSVLIVAGDERGADKARALREAGVTVFEAADAKAAVLKAMRRLPDVIVVDIAGVAEQGDWASLEVLSGRGRTAAIPIIGLRSGDQEPRAPIGFAAVLLKPVSTHELLDAARGVLGP